jgi:anaerobic magnesium-protoporphyrin IX monomethyl ester cyclase
MSDVILIGYEDEENLGLRWIASYLLAKKISTRIVPCHQAEKEEILAIIRQEAPKIVGFSLIFQRMLFDFANLMAYLRQNGVSSHFTIGGHYPSIEYEQLLQRVPELDSVVRHEGEATLYELFQRVDEPERFGEIAGLAFRRNGAIQLSPPRPLIADLDTLPLPVRTTGSDQIRGIGIRSILASRGCFYNCSFCSIHRFYHDAPGPKRRTRTPGNVVDEMEQLYAQGTKIFSFKDDDLGTRTREQRRWIETFASELEKRGLAGDILWRISCRIDEVDPGLLSRLAQVGLHTVYLGIESGSEQGLKIANKHYHVADIYRAIDNLRKIDLEYEYGFMLFDPYSTFDTVKDNIKMLEYLGNDGKTVIRFTKMFPYVGTAIERRLKDEGRLQGTIASPDYEFLDPRLNLLEVIVSQSFHDLIFGHEGLGKSLGSARFVVNVLRKFFPGQYDVDDYEREMCRLTRQCNNTALDTLDNAVEFMEAHTRDEALNSWWLAELLISQERMHEACLKKELSQVSPVPV